MKLAMSVGAGAIIAGLTYKGITYWQKDESYHPVIGGFNMQYGPYKISRIVPDTLGLDPSKKESILKFNNYCLETKTEESPVGTKELLKKI